MERRAAVEELLYTQLYPLLLRYCTALTQNQTEAQDLAQETCLRALTHPDALAQSSPGQCRSWLYKTARNLWIDRLRRAAREAPAAVEQLPEPPFEDDLTVVAVHQLLRRLPQEEQVLFRLRYLEGINATQLGEWFDLPPSTVRAKLASARKKLRRWLEE